MAIIFYSVLFGSGRIFFEPFRKNLLRLCDELTKISRDINKCPLSHKSNEQAWAFFARWADVWERMYAHGVVFVFLDFDVPHLSNYLKKYLSNKLERKEDVESVFIHLTTLDKPSFNQQEEISLLKIAAKIQGAYPKLSKDLKSKSLEALTALLRKYPTIESGLKLHANKFGWIGFGWSGPDWSYEDFIVALADIFRRKVNAGKRLQELAKEKKDIKSRRSALYKKLKIEKEYKYCFKVARDTLFLKPYRKDILYRAYSLIDPLMQEFARRLGLSVKQVKFLLPHELKNALLENKLDRNTLNERTKHCLYTIEGGEKVIVGDKMKVFLEKIKEEKIHTNVKKLEGSVACVGKASGTVKIILSVEDLSKMEDGDILVSAATNPNLMPAIRKAGAIITNEGGLTCHAAIVSREFKIPCVIGTKIATKVFKDGDLVEVDAEKGIVRKI